MQNSNSSMPMPPCGSSDPVFVISLCNGIGTIFYLLCQLGICFQGVSCEHDPALQNLVFAYWPHLSFIPDMSTFCTSTVWALVLASGCRTLLLAAGPPCQPWSSLGAQQELNDVRSSLLFQVFDIRDELTQLCQSAGVTLHWLVEEVATMSEGALQAASHRAGCPPFLIHAADFGWVHRARFIWCSTEPHDVATVDHCDVKPAGTLLSLAHVVRWLGPNQPSSFQPEYPDTHWTFRGECGKRAVVSGAGTWAPVYSNGRFLTFTTAFYHPADRGDRSNLELLARFQEDQCRFPLAHYAKGNLLKLPSGRLRPLTALERERLMGLPDHYTSPIENAIANPDKHQAHALSNARLTALGNGWHVPSITIFLISMLLGPAQPMTLCPQEGAQWSRCHCSGTVWDPQWNPQYPRTPHSVLADACSMFPPDMLGSFDLTNVSIAFEELDFSAFARFREWQEHHFGTFTPGLDISALHDPTHTADRQRSRGSGLPEPLLSRDLTEQAHIAAALALSHPFAEPPTMEIDLRFAVEAAARLLATRL